MPFWMLDDSTEANGATLMVPWLAHALASARRRGVRLGRRRRIRLLSPLSVSRSTHYLALSQQSLSPPNTSLQKSSSCVISSCVWRDLRVDLAVCDSMVVDELLYANTCPRLAPTRNYTSSEQRNTPSESFRACGPTWCRDHAHCRRTRHVYVSARSPRSSSGRFGRSPRRGGPHLTPRLAVIARFGCLNHVSSTLTSSSRVSMFIWKVPPRVSLLLIWKVLLPAHRSLVTWESPTENPTDVGFVTVPHMQRPMQRPSPPLVPSLVGFVTARPLCRVSPIRRRFRHSPTDIGFVIVHRSSVSSQPNGQRFRHSRSLSRMASLRTTSLLARGAV